MSNVISITTECYDLYSIAFCHNKIQLINSVTLKNDSDFNLKNLDLIITSSPEFFSDYSIRVGELSSGRYSDFSQIDLSIDKTKLSYLSSSVSSTVTVCVKCQGEILAESNVQVLLLPYDYIPSLSSYPELISAFVTPYQPEVVAIGDSLHKYINDESVPANIDMWKNADRDAVYSIVNGIYDSVRGLRITYNASSVLLDAKHTKTKLPEMLLSYKSGNSLEISLLFASICEYIGINSFIAFNSGKIYVGAFFTKKSTLSPINDDGRLFMDMNDGISYDCCIISPSSLANGTNISFEDSAKMASREISENDFPVIVDISECRKCGLVPMYSRIGKDSNIIFEDLSSKKSYSKFDLPSNTSQLAFKVKNSIFKNDSDSPLISPRIKNTAFLVGNGKGIVTKFLFNSRVVLKSFAVSGVVSQDSKQMLETLVKLNSNSDVTDVTDTVSTLYEKDVFDRRLIKLIDSEKSKRSLYLAFGLVAGEINGKTVQAPLFLTPASLEYDSDDFYLSISKSATVINKAVLEFLDEKIGFKLPFDISAYNYLDDYDKVTERLHTEALAFENLDFLDVVFLIKAPYEDYLTSAVSTTEHYNDSETVDNIVSGREFTASEYARVTEDALQPSFFDMPITLDASQADAYNMALANNVSVISGPNGSGKTRVAASIAHSSLKNGERVLYTSCSESNINKFKSYAASCGMSDYILTVSKNNLQKNSFCLPSAENNPEAPDEEIKQRIESSYGVISNYYSALHKVREIGFSLYEAVSQYERYKTFPYTVNFTNSDVSHLSKDDVVHLFDVVSTLAKAGADCHEPFNNPLMYVRCKDFSYELKSSALSSLTLYKNKLCKFISLQNRIVEFLGIEISVIKQEQTESLIRLAELLTDSIEFIFPSVLNIPSVESEFTEIECLLENSDNFFSIRDFINENFSNDVLSIDADALANDWRGASLKFAFTRTGAQNTVKNKLKIFATDPKSVTIDNVPDLIAKISEYKSLLSRIGEISTKVRHLFGVDLEAEISRGNRDIFEKIKKYISTTREYNSIIFDIYSSEKIPQTVFSHNDVHFSSGEKFIKDFKELYSSFSVCNQELKAAEESVVSTLRLDIDKAKKENSKIWYYFVEKFIDRMLDNLDLLKHWCAWNRAKENAENLGLKSLVNLYTTEQMTYNDIRNAFLKGFFKTVSEYILSCEPDINNFSKDSFEAIENDLIEDSERWRASFNNSFKNKMNSLIVDKLSGTHSTTFEDASMLLRREFSFNDKFYNVDENSKSLLSDIKPCLISKNLSCFSQLGVKSNSYDLLIIDTANEYKWEEIMLLLPMAKRTVIFAEETVECELISYLISHGVPHASLSYLYGCNFCTRLVSKLFYPTSTSFMYPLDERRGVKVIKQKANYDRRNTRTNFIEASTVVDEIMKKLDSSSSSSISVIAMTDEQASLIELLFTKRLQSLSDVKRKMFFDRAEDFSISSLSKASFNPCDTVIVSTTFSVEEKPKYNDTISRSIPELTGKTAIQNLIDALLCVQNELILVTSLDRELLTKFKTVIPSYLLFKQIILSLTEDSYHPDMEMNKSVKIENSIMRQVINHIESLGYKADIDIGNNSCRVDVAVKRQNVDGYIFGIVLDESAYMYGGDLISRSMIRKNLENNFGWRILRIYTVEWFENSPKQLDIITEMLKGESEEKQTIISFDSF